MRKLALTMLVLLAARTAGASVCVSPTSIIKGLSYDNLGTSSNSGGCPDEQPH